MVSNNLSNPKISIITPSFNQGSFIEETILSVLDQNYPNIEYIIIDGGSTDESVDIIRKYDDKLTFWVSESDDGQADAINKGLQKATGDWVGFLNSDDILKPGALHKIAESSQSDNPDWICGGVHIFGNDGADYGIKQPSPSRQIADWLVYDAQVPQQGSFWKRELISKVGLMNTSFHFAFDMEYWIRLVTYDYFPKIIPDTLAGFRIHEITKSMGGRSKFIQEHRRILDQYAEMISKKDQTKTEKKLRRMMAEALVYDSASHAESGNSEKARRLLSESKSEYWPVVFKRYFWGAKRRIQ